MPDSDILIWAIAITIGLWVIASISSAIETSLLSLRPSEIQSLAEGSRAKKPLRAIAEETTAYSYSLWLVRVFCETAAAMLVAICCMLIVEHLWLALLIAILIVSLATFVLVGISPRSVALAYAPQVLRYGAGVARLAHIVFGWAAKGLYVIGNKITPGSERFNGFRDEEQLLTMVDEATELEMLEEDDRELIHSVFEFGDTVVREVMVPRIDMITIDDDEQLSYGLDQFLNKAISRIPVIGKDADEVVGVLYLRDVVKFMRRYPQDWAETPVTQLSKPAMFVPESKKADDTLKLMQEDFNHLAIVVDEYGGVAGLVTLEDLIEELVGDIADEYDREIPEITQIDEHSYEVSARLPLDELGELFNLELDDEDVDSVGGWFTKLLGRIPVQESSVQHGTLTLTAKGMQRRPKRVITVLVEHEPVLEDETGEGSDEYSR